MMGPGAGPTPAQQECLQKIGPLRDDAQKKGQAIQAASKRHAPPQEACKLLQEFSKAETRFVSFIVSKQTACQIPAEVPTQLKSNHAKTEELVKKVCTAAANGPQGPAGPTLSDVIGSPTVPEAPTKRTGGSTFDTISGNVLAR